MKIVNNIEKKIIIIYNSIFQDNPSNFSIYHGTELIEFCRNISRAFSQGRADFERQDGQHLT